MTDGNGGSGAGYARSVFRDGQSLRWFRVASTPRLMILSGVVGAGAGLGAVVLIQAIELVQAGVRHLGDTLSLGDFWPILIVPLGLWLSWRLTSLLAPEAAGHGVPQIIASIAVRGGRVRPRLMGVKTAATALTIGSGGSAGREGSIAQIGSAIGSWVGRVSKLSENDVRVLVAAGAGAGISATFNAPIAGMLFAMEVILQEFALRHVHTIVVASVVGAVVSHSLIGEELTFSVSPYSLDDPRQLILYVVLGLAAAGAAWLYLVLLDRFETGWTGLPKLARPLLFGIVVAVSGLIRPEVLGTGQEFVAGILRNEANLVWWVLLSLALLKALATAATLGGRGAGGIFMPSLFIGATTGSATAVLFQDVWSWSVIRPGGYALVGMAATFSAVARAPLTSILIVFEITGDYGLVLPLMIATAISTILAGRVRPESAYTAPLSRMGIHPIQAAVTDLLDTVTVAAVMTPGAETVEANATLGEVQGMLVRTHRHGLPVTADGELVGIISNSDVVRAGGPSDQMVARDAMTPNPTTVHPDTRVSEALERMAALGVGRLPVVAADDPGRIIGMFRRESVITAYHRALGATAQAHSQPDRVNLRTQSDARFTELIVPSGSVADRRPVSEVPWPEACLLVSIHRGTKQLVPSGQTLLHAGDAITVFGGREAASRLRERLAGSIESG